MTQIHTPPPLFDQPKDEHCAACGRVLNQSPQDTWPTKCFRHPGIWCNACMVEARFSPACCPAQAKRNERIRAAS